VSSLVVGSIAIDTVETPFGKVNEALGGTAVYFALAASLFTKVQLVGVIGDDFPDHAIELLQSRGVDLAGLQKRHGETFRWVGQYDYDMNVAHTLDTRLNVFGTFHPSLPEHYRDAEFLFLGNIDPDLQLEVLKQVRNPSLIALDTMNFWIEGKRDALTDVLRRVDTVLINEGEIREYTKRYSVLEAARDLMELGPRQVVVKRGEYGCVLFSGEDVFLTPAFPTWDVRDTTGAGDSFAGAFVGYLDQCRSLRLDDLKAAVVYGTVIASFTVEDFSVNGLLRATQSSVAARYDSLAGMTRIETTHHVPSRNLISEGV
jgi:sugar/nucleoside kinase (ribokinase family)